MDSSRGSVPTISSSNCTHSLFGGSPASSGSSWVRVPTSSSCTPVLAVVPLLHVPIIPASVVSLQLFPRHHPSPPLPPLPPALPCRNRRIRHHRHLPRVAFA